MVDEPMIGWIFVVILWVLGLMFVIQAWSEGAQYWAVVYGVFVATTLYLMARSRKRTQ